ncbi:MAG: hypothetical protein HYU98_05460 [Deltaproteobacteria bacterium]|nr:hypothetical protein [Deltaproteobacteria bacterium]
MPIELLALGAYPPQSNEEITTVANASINQAILDSYIDFAVKAIDSQHWCEAFLLGLSTYIEDDKRLRQAIKQLNGEKGLLNRFEAVKDEFKMASWGRSEDFIVKKNGRLKVKAGRYEACSSQNDQDCIFLNPGLAMELGSCRAFKDFPMTYSEVTLLHEGLHKLFEITGIIKNGLIKPNEEEKVIEKILKMYFVGSEYSYELKRASQRHNLADLFSACNSSENHASHWFDRVEGVNVSHPAAPKPRVLQVDVKPTASALDFNNDGIEDYTESSDFDYCPRFSQKYRSYEECEWEFIEPNLKGKNSRDVFWLIPYDEDDEKCRLPKIHDKNGKEITPVTVWRLPYNVPNVWEWPFMKFRSSDRLMSFKPGQKVALRNSPSKQIDLRSPVVFYNPATGVQIGTIYAVLPKCRFVPLDDLIYVTKTGRPLDMRKAFELAESGSVPEETMEWQVARLIRGARDSIAASNASPEAMRDIILHTIKQNPLSADLPDGWEAGVLYALKLPQEEWVRTKPLLDGKSCGFK